MNTRLTVAVTLAAGAALGSLFNHALPAQAQTPPASQSLDAKVLLLETQVTSLRQQVTALQAQVTHLKASKAVMSGGFGPVYQPNSFPNSFSFQSQTFPDYGPRRYKNIPPCQVTLLSQPTH